MYTDPKSLRIVYMGTPDFAVAPLRALVEGGYNIVTVVTMPDKPAGRGLKMQESAVKRYAKEVGLPVMQPEKLKSEEFAAALRELDPDLGIVVAFKMLPATVFSLPRYGTFNLHASLLPQYRGAAPINWAIINGETETGVTTFMLNPRMDEGAVIDRRVVSIDGDDNAGTLHDKLMVTGAGLVTESVGKIVSEGFVPQPQPTVAASELKSAPKIFKETCHLNFENSGRDIINLIRGLSPYPGAWVSMKECVGEETVRESQMKIYAARFEPADTSAVRCGDGFVSDGVLRIACRDGYVLPDTIQPAGKQRMGIREYLNGLKHKECLRFR